MKNKVILALFAGLAVGLAGCEQSHRNTVTFTVESKERRCDSNGDQGVKCAYYVYGTNGEVFRNEDAIVFGSNGGAKFDSATFQAKLQAGHTYTVETIGWRIPWASMSPNIVKIDGETKP